MLDRLAAIKQFVFLAAKELEKPIPLVEKTISPKQLPAIIAPVTPAPTTEIPPPEQSLIREEKKLPEVQVPIKKYYGRKRDSQSSSSENEYEDEATAVTNSTVKIK